MDGSNNGDNAPKNMSRAEYARSIKAAMEERRQRAMTNRQQFEPQIHEQINRLFQNYEAPLYARMRGFGKPRTLALAESTVLSLAAVNGRNLEDSETQALTEHFLSSIHNLLIWKWTMTGLAVYMTYRGRRTYRFPFFNPEFKRFSPIGGSPAIQFMWHSARFAAYYASLWILGEPVFQGGNFMRQRAAMERDPRIRSLLHEGKAQGATLLGGSPDANSQIRDAWESASQEESSSQQKEGDSTSDVSVPQSTWAAFRTQAPPPAQPQQTSSSWDSGDDFDDASPTAASFRNQSSSGNYGGSSWDRVRQQSQYQPKPQDQRSWEKPQSGGGWGSDVDAGRQTQAPRESYAFSAMDEEKNAAKEQSQREFDRLLDRERSGGEQERNTWSKK
ncbi:hypothetical protein PT974_11990 [Cladobotryum mycophilum]|uniref:Uncharacterized protein n=1 Tax=Cladobotryum mycophilum TaxID=491253 RepID=A0ABR0S7U7_9HYPO